MKAPTPLTDAAAINVCLNWDGQCDHVRKVVSVEFARSLEQQLRTAKADLETLAHAAQSYLSGQQDNDAENLLIDEVTAALQKL